ncbi:MAG: hypothetical protein KDD90_02815, partial [Sphingomonadaceae bacterium]|nr:hypothetical protein [Sphingomonadaceae bacterium]
NWFPDFHRGSRLSVRFWRPKQWAVEAASAASVRAIYARSWIRSTPFFFFFSRKCNYFGNSIIYDDPISRLPVGSALLNPVRSAILP